MPLTDKTAAMIATGQIRLQDGRVDSLLYKKPALKPDGDDDGDGIKNSAEIYTYTSGKRTFYAYNTHPRLEDSDGDGLIDSQDNFPLKWDISPRDMALFMELAYREDDYIKQVLNPSVALSSNYEGRREYTLMHNELAPFWHMRRSFHEGNGFDAVLFESSSKFVHLPQNQVQVLAVRGTKGQLDLDDDINLFLGTEPGQAGSMRRILELLSKDASINNLYVTGHSLGGHLAMRGLVEADKFGFDFYKKAYTFNAPKIRGNAFNKWLYGVGDTANRLTKEGRAQHFIVDNDGTIGAVGTFDGAVSIGTSGQGHGSRSYFEERVNSLGHGFTVGKRANIHGDGYRQPGVGELNFDQTFKDADVYKIDAIGKEILEGEKSNLSDVLRPEPALPEDVYIQDLTDYNALKKATARKEPYKGLLRVVFVDGSMKTIEVPITVFKAANMIKPIVKIKPESIIPEVIEAGEPLDLEGNIANLDEDAAITPLEKLDTSKPGKYEVKVKVTFLSGASRIVKIPVTVLAKEPEIAPEDIIPEVVRVGEQVDFDGNIANLPDDAKVTPLQTVDTSKPGKYVVEVQVTYASGVTRIVKIPVTVLNNLQVDPPRQEALPEGHPPFFVPTVAPKQEVLPEGHPPFFVPTVAPKQEVLPEGHPPFFVPTVAPKQEALPDGNPHAAGMQGKVDRNQKRKHEGGGNKPLATTGVAPHGLLIGVGLLCCTGLIALRHKRQQQ
ncbi:Rib/alpha-like domain-containing protein [Winkia neuii]|nr:Rib/alpha-like domain-containing protein [Winkia neuii]